MDIQQAINSLTGPGTINIPKGVYRLRNALKLRDGVRLVGEPGAVLTRVPSVESRLLDYVGYGHYEISVEEPELFNIGMGIHVTADTAGGFYDTVATIIGRQARTLS